MTIYVFWLIVAYLAFNFLLGGFAPSNYFQDIELFGRVVPDYNMFLRWHLPIKMAILWVVDIFVFLTFVYIIKYTKQKFYRALSILVLVPIIVVPFLDFISYQPNTVFTNFGQPGFFPDKGLILRNVAETTLLLIAFMMGMAGSLKGYHKFLVAIVILTFSTHLFSPLVSIDVSSELFNLRMIVSIVTIFVATIRNWNFVKTIGTSIYAILMLLWCVLLIGIFLYIGGSLAWALTNSIVWTVVGTILGPVIGVILLAFGLSLLMGTGPSGDILIFLKKR